MDCIFFFSSAFALITGVQVIDGMSSYWYTNFGLEHLSCLMMAAINCHCFALCWDQAYPKGDKDEDANWKKVNHKSPKFAKCWIWFTAVSGLLCVFGMFNPS